MNPRVTLQAMAKQAGVSVMTVSMAMRNSPEISAARRKQIQQLAKRLGYRPNPLISALITSRRHGRLTDVTTIAVIDSHADPLLQKQIPASQQRIKGIEERAQELGFKVDLVHAALYDFKDTRINAVLKNRGIRGVIFDTGIDPKKDIILDWEHFALVKTVAFYPKMRLHIVHSNPGDAIRMTLDKLTGYGYKKIGLAISEASNNTLDNIVTGTFFDYQSQIPAKQRVPVFRPLYPWGPEYRKEGDLCQWYRRHRPDVIVSHEFNYHDELELFGVKAPKDVAWAKYAVPDHDKKMAGTIIHAHEVGRAAVDLLVQQLYSNTYGIPRVPTKLMVSCAEWIDGPTVPKPIIPHISCGR